MKNSIESELLKVNYFQIDINCLYSWTSGIKSPIYCDNRKINSFITIRELVLDGMIELINSKKKLLNFDIVAGVATGGIPIGMLIAYILKKPFVYVRPTPKQHGLKQQIEGTFEKGQKTLVVEDHISTGKSSLNAINVLGKEKLDVIGLVSIMSYEFKEAKTAFAQQKTNYFSLTNLDLLLDVAEKEKRITPEEKKTILNFRENPAAWQNES